MTTFVNAMDAAFDGAAYGRTENGAPQLTTSSDSRVDFFFNTVRSTPKDRVLDLMSKIMSDVRKAPSLPEKASIAADLITTLFHLRATRNMGKGERHLFVLALVHLHREFPSTVESLVTEIPFYGSFKDLLEIVVHEDVDGRLEKACLEAFAQQLVSDSRAIEASKADGSSPSISFAGKWAPREGKSYDKVKQVVDALCQLLYSSDDVPIYQKRKQYRRLIVALNARLNVPEVMMSAQKWAEINFKQMPALCLDRHRKAFLNEDLKNPVRASEEQTGNRFPDDAARVACRQNMIDVLVNSKGIHADQLFPHTIVEKLQGYRSRSSMDYLLCKAQWKSIRDSVLASMAEQMEKIGTDSVPSDRKSSLNLGNLVPLVDVSGSMSGQPMHVAIAMGILVSEIAAAPFKDRVLTFESQPRWFPLCPDDSIVEKVEKLGRAPWGGSTNFTAALKLIYEVVQAQRLSMDQVPDMIVFSDMQFDMADRGFKTHYESIKQEFARLGMEISGEPYLPPRIIFWNLRGNSFSGVHAPVTAAQENVQLLSGFSPSMLKLVLAGEFAEEEEIVESEDADGNVVVTRVKKKVTPYDTYRKAIDCDVFDRVRVKLAASTEGVLAHYSFAPSEEEGV